MMIEIMGRVLMLATILIGVTSSSSSSSKLLSLSSYNESIRFYNIPLIPSMKLVELEVNIDSLVTRSCYPRLHYDSIDNSDDTSFEEICSIDLQGLSHFWTPFIDNHANNDMQEIHYVFNNIGISSYNDDNDEGSECNALLFGEWFNKQSRQQYHQKPKLSLNNKIASKAAGASVWVSRKTVPYNLEKISHDDKSTPLSKLISILRTALCINLHHESIHYQPVTIVRNNSVHRKDFSDILQFQHFPDAAASPCNIEAFIGLLPGKHSDGIASLFRANEVLRSPHYSQQLSFVLSEWKCRENTNRSASDLRSCGRRINVSLKMAMAIRNQREVEKDDPLVLSVIRVSKHGGVLPAEMLPSDQDVFDKFHSVHNCLVNRLQTSGGELPTCSASLCKSCSSFSFSSEIAKVNCSYNDYKPVSGAYSFRVLPNHLRVDRIVSNIRNTFFDVVVSFSVPLMGGRLLVVNPIVLHYTILLHTFRTSSFNFSSEPAIQCATNGGECSVIVAFDFPAQLEPTAFDVSFTVHRILLAREYHRPDASAGLLLLPTTIIFSPVSTTDFVVSSTPANLIPAVIPDFSMPFNVVTLSCTLLAFLLGSMMNSLTKNSMEKLVKS